MDNFALRVRCRHKPMLMRAFEIAFCRDSLVKGGWDQNVDGEPKSSTATHVVFTPEEGLSFLWHKDSDMKDIQPLAAILNWEGAAEYAWNWLLTAAPPPPPSEYHDDPDVWEFQAWEVFVSDWGHAANSLYGIVSVRRDLAWIGK